MDPVKGKHTISDSGVYVIDGLSGEIANLEEGVASKVMSFFKKDDDKETRKFDKSVSKDLVTLTPEKNLEVTQSTDYGLSKIAPEIKERAVNKVVIDRVIDKNIKDEPYEVRVNKDKTEKHKLKIVPKASEIAIKKLELIHVPLWNIEFECGDQTYERKILAASQTVITDDIGVCPEHFQLGGLQFIRKQTVAVCEICGKALCKDHVTFAPDGIYYCKEHLPEQYRPKETNNSTSLLFRFGKDKH
jgi:hypothetical protein